MEHTPKSPEQKPDAAEELTDETLGDVSGGIGGQFIQLKEPVIQPTGLDAILQRKLNLEKKCAGMMGS